MTITIGGIVVTIDNGRATWTSGMEVDCDGSANAYAPPGSGLVGLDAIGNAWSKPASKWVGVACSDSPANQKPYIQGPNDPYPGMYVSTSALVNRSFPEWDPRRYIDGSVEPFIVIPPDLVSLGLKKGDLAWLTCGTKSVAAIVGDVGPHGHLGEGSPAAHMALGFDVQRANPPHRLVGISAGVSFTVFFGSLSTPAWPRTDIVAAVDALLAPS